MALQIVAGDPALDLVNTVEPRIAGTDPERDHLLDPSALLDWALRARVLDEGEAAGVAAAWTRDPDLAESEHAAVLQLRAAVGTAVDAALSREQGPPVQDALDVVVQQAAAALSRTALVPDPAGEHPSRRRDGATPGRLIADRLALDALEVLEGADLRRLKSCPPADGGCGWVFVDTSKNGTRRWCSMEDCGTHAKSRRLTERRRALRRAAREGGAAD